MQINVGCRGVIHATDEASCPRGAVLGRTRHKVAIRFLSLLRRLTVLLAAAALFGATVAPPLLAAPVAVHCPMLMAPHGDMKIASPCRERDDTAATPCPAMPRSMADCAAAVICAAIPVPAVLDTGIVPAAHLARRLAYFDIARLLVGRAIPPPLFPPIA
jgi:hypothetical protein